MKNDSSHKSLLHDLFYTIVRAIPIKGWFVIAGLVLGVPTSYYGVQWILFKTAKQNVNCQSDFYLGLPQSNTTDPSQYADQIDAELKNYLSCVQNVDPKISTRKFIREEIKRL